MGRIARVDYSIKAQPGGVMGAGHGLLLANCQSSASSVYNRMV